MRLGVGDLLRSMPLTISGVLQQGGNSGLILLVSGALGAAIVPVFATTRTVTNLWTTLINVLTAPLLPDVVRFYARGERRKLLSAHQVHWLLIGSGVNVSILLAYPFLGTLYVVWTRHGLAFDKRLLCMLLAAVSLNGMSALVTLFLSGVNHFGFIVTSAVIRGGIALSLAIALLPALGLFGLGMSIFGAELTVLVISIQWFLKRELAKDTLDSRPVLISSWFWFSSMCLVMYFLSECFPLPFEHSRYFLALCGVMLGPFAAYRGLEGEIQLRVRSLYAVPSFLK